MICEKYDTLTTREKIEFIGRLNHAVMNSDVMFDYASILVKTADRVGLFENVIINPGTSINELKTGQQP